MSNTSTLAAANEKSARSAHLLEAARSEREQREFHARSAEVLKKHAFTAAKVILLGGVML